MIKKPLQHQKDTFYYVLNRYYTDNTGDHKTFNVFVYKYDQNLDKCFDHNLMFETKEQADKVCQELIKNESY